MESFLLTCPNPMSTPEGWPRTPPSVRQMVRHVLERLAVTVGLLAAPYRQRLRQTLQTLEDCLHVDVALTVNTLRQEVSAAMADPVTEAARLAPTPEVANAGATGGMQSHGDGATLQRRISLGTRSALRSPFVAWMLTVTLTLRSQQCDVLESLTTACETARRDAPDRHRCLPPRERVRIFYTLDMPYLLRPVLTGVCHN